MYKEESKLKVKANVSEILRRILPIKKQLNDLYMNTSAEALSFIKKLDFLREHLSEHSLINDIIKKAKHDNLKVNAVKVSKSNGIISLQIILNNEKYYLSIQGGKGDFSILLQDKNFNVKEGIFEKNNKLVIH